MLYTFETTVVQFRRAIEYKQMLFLKFIDSNIVATYRLGVFLTQIFEHI